MQAQLLGESGSVYSAALHLPGARVGSAAGLALVAGRGRSGRVGAALCAAYSVGSGRGESRVAYDKSALCAAYIGAVGEPYGLQK
jgi:hypothetical protein